MIARSRKANNKQKTKLAADYKGENQHPAFFFADYIFVADYICCLQVDHSSLHFFDRHLPKSVFCALRLDEPIEVVNCYKPFSPTSRTLSCSSTAWGRPGERKHLELRTGVPNCRGTCQSQGTCTFALNRSIALARHAPAIKTL